MGGRIIQKTTKHRWQWYWWQPLQQRRHTHAALSLFFLCPPLPGVDDDIIRTKWRWQYWRPDWKFPCWRLQLSPSCIPIPKHGRHSTLYICILYAHCEKEWTRFLPTQTSVARPQRNKSVMSSFWSSSFNMDSFWMQQRPLNVNTWLIKLRGKEFLISEFKKGYNLFEVVKEARVCINKRFLPLQNCLCCYWNLRISVF